MRRLTSPPTATLPGNRTATRRVPVFGLGAKTALWVVIGTVVMIGLFAYLATAALSENTQRNLQERVILAQMTASYTDALIDNIENVLTHTAGEQNWSNPQMASTALDQAYRRLSPYASHVFLLDAGGDVVAAQPEAPDIKTFKSVIPVISVLNGTPFAISQVAQQIVPSNPGVVAASPIRNSVGEVSGALAIILDFTNPNIRAFSNPIGLGQTGYMDLVAFDGRILASTRPGRIGSESDHGSTLSGLIRDHRQSVSACHDCHTPLPQTTPQEEVLAFAPLTRVQWGVAVHQSEAEVFAPTRILQTRIIGLMIIMLASALVLVYFTTRSVIQPIQALTVATQRIAQGDLDSPIQWQGKDEIGVLARSFDEMRLRLKNSTEEIQAWNRELDARVQERTAAYQAAARDNARLYAELQRKEQLRGELLRRVISAQEDERKRIARELHDETSQSLTALMVGLDTVHMASAHDLEQANKHLDSCKSIAAALLQNIHRLVADLRPSLLDDLGLVPAIAWYGEQRLKPLGIKFSMNEHDLAVRLPPSIETALFRIFQEAITNIIRHAHATEVSVKLARRDNKVSLIVADNGRGFDPDALEPADAHGQGLGLRGMQERASILDGEFQLQTGLGKGTVITIIVPVPE
jgi:signal transduction histidine kinase